LKENLDTDYLLGSKHWPTDKQDTLWAWFVPYIPTIFRENIKSDTLSIWSSFLEVITTDSTSTRISLTIVVKYMFFHKDPRRVQPLVDFLVDAFNNLDFNAELSFDAVKIITLFKTFWEELGRKFDAWTNKTVERAWSELHGEHEEVGTFV